MTSGDLLNGSYPDDGVHVLLEEFVTDDVEQEDIEDEFSVVETEENGEIEVERGKLSLYGTGLLGCIAGTSAEFFVQISKQDAMPNGNESQLQVTLRPRVNKMKLLGSGLTPPSSIIADIRLLEPKNESPNTTFSVTYKTTFAASYQVTIEFPHSKLSHIIPGLTVDPGEAHTAGCSIKGAGIRGAVSEMPSSFRLLLGDEYKNPIKSAENIEIETNFTRLSTKPECKKITERRITKQNDESFTITYTAPISGKYELEILLNGENIKDSPFSLQVVAGMAEKERERQRKLKRKKKPAKTKTKTPRSPVIVIPKKVKKDPKLVRFEEHTEQIVLGQSAIRRFLAYKQFKVLRERNTNRLQVIQELMQSEEEYISNLERLMNFFMIPIKQQHLMDEKQISQTFCNIEFICGVNLEMNSSFQERTNGNSNVILGDVFNNFTSQLQSSYSIYVNNYNMALNTLAGMIDNENFQEFVETTSKDRNIELMTLLMAPIQRIRRYEELLKKLLEFTDSEYPDFPMLVEAVENMKKVNCFIRDEKKLAERLHRLLRISQKVYDVPANFDFLDLNVPHRDYLGQGPISIYQKKRTFIRQVIVFTDAIIIARKKISIARGSKNLSFRHLFIFDSIRVVLPDENSVKLCGDNGLLFYRSNNTFVNKFGPGVEVVLLGQTKRDSQWLDAIKGVLKRYRPQPE